MDTSAHTLAGLFAQLGLDNDEHAISEFIYRHKGLEDKIELAKANLWNTSQQQFLQEAIQDDSDWAEVVDQLNALLR